MQDASALFSGLPQAGIKWTATLELEFEPNPEDLTTLNQSKHIFITALLKSNQTVSDGTKS